MSITERMERIKELARQMAEAAAGIDGARAVVVQVGSAAPTIEMDRVEAAQAMPGVAINTDLRLAGGAFRRRYVAGEIDGVHFWTADVLPVREEVPA